MTSSIADADRERLARLLVHAERVVATRRSRDIAGPWLHAARCVDALALFSILLPWTTVAGVTLPGYRVSFVLVAATLVSIVLRQLVRTMVLARTDASSRRALVLLEVTSSVVVVLCALDAVLFGRTDAGGEFTPAPAVLVFAVVAATWCALVAARGVGDAVADLDLLAGPRRWDPDDLVHRLGRAVDEAGAAPARRPSPVFATGVIVFAAATLLGPWQQIGSSARLGYDLPETATLRWTVAVAAAVVALALTAPRLRPASDVVLAAAGAAIGAVGVRTALEVTQISVAAVVAIEIAAVAALLPLLTRAVPRRTTSKAQKSATDTAPHRLARSTLGVAVAAYPCALLAWTLPLVPYASIPRSEPVRDSLLALGPWVIAAAALLWVTTLRATPALVRVVVLLATAGLAGYAVLVAFRSLDPSNLRVMTGPAGWVCCALYAGTAALALFVGAAMYDDWRDRHGKAAEHVAARRRVLAVLPVAPALPPAAWVAEIRAGP